MAFPPHFLEEIRTRLSLADVIGRRVRLTRKGREHSGLCPFHNEKTPSFTVSEEKGFYHCFGCGAHGDVIGFIMRSENLSFPEAVERLARDAGLDVPVTSPEERQRAKRQATLLDAVEAACAFFERQLRSAQGRPALEYLRRRGLDDATVARFRLGYAPESRSALKSALVGETITEAMLVEAGLLIRPDDGGASYDRFRGRVTFPIADRRGRVIAFGARALGDVQPKYLNSPDTPLFHKGQVLYGLATAWPAARDKGRVVVCEGYMDVIALQRAGIVEAVAPLGTALTETQIELLWRMAPEPVLCFDGDTAGQRAAARAAERALPLLKPGLSLRFVALPPGEDPDSLVLGRGAPAMERALDDATALADLVWSIETAGKRVDTPERIAGLEHRLETRALAIADRKVQYQYLSQFRRRLREAAQGARFTGRRPGGIRPDRGSRPGMSLPAAAGNAWRSGFDALSRRDQQILLAVAVNHPSVLEDYIEVLGTLHFSDAALDKLRQEILLLSGQIPDLDTDMLKRHLRDREFSHTLDVVLAPDVYVHAGFARPEADGAVARAGFDQVVHRLREPERQAQLAEAERAFAEDPTEENWTRLQTSTLSTQRQPPAEDGVSVAAGSRSTDNDLKILSS